ncbi:DUF1311 domain-containing protein [Paraflavitalea soli]|uniref:DUF1311 domain-containing protein n=1 Tax=Paraflavitalea soli TaxID=2315862 RepID=A0A3B7MZZ5_9BACT|nr:lysozyme inhibitor LprI family protein [Paraflavitalea soli]AXY78799.1 DUF1311 domain-containing protein [Paraflavitalea soli]
MIRVFFSLILCCTSILCVAQSQVDMNLDAKKKFQAADKELNATYQQILKDYSKDPVFIANFKKAQKLWVQFRDAEMKAKYPDREPGYYGSVQPMCWSMYLTELTIERTTKLKVWTTGIEEGDVCAGTVKTKK